MASELSAIRAKLEQLLERGASTDSSARSAPEDVTLRELAAAMKEISVRLATSSPDRSQRLRDLAASSEDHAASRAKLFESRFSDERTSALTDQHRFWTYEDILRTYGPPTSIVVSEGTPVWVYQQPGVTPVQFRFADGMVFTVW